MCDNRMTSEKSNSHKDGRVKSSLFHYAEVVGLCFLAFVSVCGCGVVSVCLLGFVLWVSSGCFSSGCSFGCFVGDFLSASVLVACLSVLSGDLFSASVGGLSVCLRHVSVCFLPRSLSVCILAGGFCVRPFLCVILALSHITALWRKTITFRLKAQYTAQIQSCFLSLLPWSCLRLFWRCSSASFSWRRNARMTVRTFSCAVLLFLPQSDKKQKKGDTLSNHFKTVASSGVLCNFISPLGHRFSFLLIWMPKPP
ncbi:hypothetical protein Ae201684_001159 [Aphanomyces euteiches]|uniref:Uncharacterized protein n=1 Tax=Aphanomyces euteiches TaxID=100861 RepID=A0A6G0XW33_9STRA|nr:hypothetical protein Ae201684_001159 [Aphanomyces euteiches]